MLDGFLGAVVGFFAALAAVWLQTWLQDQKDEPRRKLLRKMLADDRYEWRELETLARVIGASKEDTTRLLVSIDARGAEDGREVWALISRKPLP